MSALLLLLVCLALGVVLAHVARPPASVVPGLNWWSINIALPALVLRLIPHVQFQRSLWFLIVANWLVFAAGWLFMALLGRLLGWSRARIGALTLVAGLGNTAFMGYPMVEALRGHAALSLAVIGDQAGCFTALAVGGVAVAAVYAGQAVRPAQIVRRIVLFPSFLALCVGIGVGALGGWPEMFDDLLGHVSSTLTPLAMFSVGLQQRFTLPGERIVAIGVGLGWKMLLAPALCWVVGRAFGVPGLIFVVGVLQAAMPPMVSAAILADQYELEPPLANTLLGTGLLLSLATLQAINALL